MYIIIYEKTKIKLIKTQILNEYESFYNLRFKN